MAPSAISPDVVTRHAGEATAPFNGHDNWQSRPVENGASRAFHSTSSLYAPALHEVHDLVGVGFGPASLAIAVALSDGLEAQESVGHGFNTPKVRFLERQNGFKWHAGMLLPGAKMQISFLKDLATLRDPCSHFTFLNYLKEHGRLVQFTNLATFLPSRLEFDDYLQWAATHFNDVVEYGQQVQSIHPRKLGNSGKYDCFEVVSRDLSTGESTTILSRNVVVAVGGQPARPAIFPTYHERILHSSEYNIRIERILPDKEKAYSIAIMGGGQSGAEVFNNLHERYPNATTRLIFRDSALRPSDDSPFVNEVFNPEAVDTFFEQPQDFRSKNLAKNKATNYSVVRLELIEKIYDDLYLQSIHSPDRREWQHQILPLREISDFSDNGKQLTLNVTNLDPLSGNTTETMSFDALILATGYRRDAHNELLKDCQLINGNRSGIWEPGRDYSLNLDDLLVEDGAGLWLQGCNEATHGLSDSLLSILSTRSGELVDSIFGAQIKLNGH
ncbi:L-ornithine N5-oxygenase [Exophiala aquamarina CBS 119918]|uniref:L-ornithine N(5)-monooxygenase n=1 Tax=Exophiala aquamarina CBS 119918 TaxID=1182545 RepID=A0A072PUK2_9EURO|nr:L-ornithine N5-oxygenase [Exophiala aquamarina CBS 119918]KEF63754.1 L-ornithine N5-oxygenase [Exophiala aquamarina CBS 119918]